MRVYGKQSAASSTQRQGMEGHPHVVSQSLLMLYLNRTEIRELQIIREAFMSRYGREWAISCMENTNGQVSPRVLAKCKLETPAKDWVDLYLYEVSKAYQVNWRPEGFLSDTKPDTKPGETEPDTAAQEQRLLEAELSKGDGTDSKDKDEKGDSDDENSGDLASKLPSAPSSQPHLGNVKNSTTSIPIIKPENSKETHNTEDSLGLPTSPSMDPAQSGRTVFIKSNLGQSPNSKSAAAPSEESSKKAGDTAYDVSLCSPHECRANKLNDSSQDLARRFAALKRK